MELQEFIKQVLIDVMTGVGEAQKKLKELENNGVVNATGIVDSDPHTNPHNRSISDIEIDVAVTVESGRGTRTGGGINVVKILEAGREKTGNELNSTTSRVKLAVPVVYPYLNP